jgi:hypothetical protein
MAREHDIKVLAVDDHPANFMARYSPTCSLAIGCRVVQAATGEVVPGWGADGGSTRRLNGVESKGVGWSRHDGISGTSEPPTGRAGVTPRSVERVLASVSRVWHRLAHLEEGGRAR